jgi:hypothetical protein
MSTLSELALKGHFEELKKQFNKREATRWERNLPEEITAMIGRAIKMAEDFYEHDPDFFTNDHKEDYQLMIKVINSNGYTYKGHPDLIDDDQMDTSFPGKKPMQKAGVTQKQEQKKRDAG